MSSGKQRWRLFLTILCGLGVGVLLYMSWRPEIPLDPRQKPLNERGVALFNSRYEGWEGAKRIWTLEAAEIFRTTDGKTVNFRGIENIRLYQEDDRILAIKADTGRLDLKQNVLTLTGVQGEINGGRLHTAGLKVDLERKEIASTHPLSFAKEGLELQANRMEGNFETEEYLFSGDLEVVQGKHRSRGQVFTYYAKEDRFELKGDVEVELEL
ncbi:MAG TPA: LPS export ABC transporter periplasmic protein LptC [Firmicutes bacterium]|nr:LPS export ABC transporter periplasmic protein LptC [Bacillota bacterium]